MSNKIKIPFAKRFVKQKVITAMLCIVFSLSASVLNAQPKVTWDFPVNPSTPEWKELKSYEEQLLAYNIPVEIINKISTQELVKICLAYPEWGVINAFNDRRIGLNNMMGKFNGFHDR